MVPRPFFKKMNERARRGFESLHSENLHAAFSFVNAMFPFLQRNENVRLVVKPCLLPSASFPPPPRSPAGCGRPATARRLRGVKRRQEEQAWDWWLDCISQVDIAERLGTSQQNISNWIQNRERSSEICSPPDSRQHFDIWQFQTADDDSGSNPTSGPCRQLHPLNRLCNSALAPPRRYPRRCAT